MKKLAFISVLVAVIGTCFTVSAFAEFYVISAQNKCGPCKGTRSAGGRWCNNGDGTVTDMTTCLVWLKYADWGLTRAFWLDSIYAANAHNRAGLLASGETIFESGETVVNLADGSDEGDWRLPTLTELSGIINEGDESVCHSNMQLFEGVQSNYYWSSSMYVSDTGEAWAVSMSNGNELHDDKFLYAFVWPVRSTK
ncbi:MAG: DUF1566 domain-containing protein [Deltaproteobacteria bacterium]|nr:DUF1566 domain-containing protein [Deltaproteobacteria bacterium]